jgi:hypothetical protein
MRGIFWPDEEMLAFEEELCFIYLFCLLVGKETVLLFITKHNYSFIVY